MDIVKEALLHAKTDLGACITIQEAGTPLKAYGLRGTVAKIEAALAALDAKSDAATWPDQLTDPLREALGLMNFTTGPIAHAYRAAGHEIPRKCEDEQAFVLHRLAGIVLKHGPDWRRVAGDELKAMRDTKATEPT